METKSQKQNLRRARKRAEKRAAKETKHEEMGEGKTDETPRTSQEEREAVAHLVVHCRRKPFDVYIGRGGRHELKESIWGNPFRLKSEAERNQVCENFETYLLNNPTLLAKVKDLKGKVLGCWCSPRRCHGHTLAALANR